MLPQAGSRLSSRLGWLGAASAVLGIVGVGSTSPAMLDAVVTNNSSIEESETGPVVEPHTNVPFSRVLSVKPPPKEVAGDYLLVGTAVRCMLGQCSVAYARAYAVGLYVEDSEAARRWINPEVEPKEEVEMRKDLLSSVGVSRRLVLIMDREISGHHVAKGFDRSLLSRVRFDQGGFKQGPGKEALREFTKCFNRMKTIKKGTEIALQWTPDNRLVVTIDGELTAVIYSSILCAAIFNTYLGPDSVFSKYRNTSFVFHKYQAPPPGPVGYRDIPHVQSAFK